MGVFLDSVLGQPEAIDATSAALLGDQALLTALVGLPASHDRIVLTGMGSSYAACYGAHLRLLEAGLASTLIETSELLHYGAAGLGPRTLLVLVSQSGETIEVVRLLDALAARPTVVGVTNHPESTLATRSDLAVILRAGVEGIVATRTYVATVAAAQIIAAALTGSVGNLADRLAGAAGALRALLGRRETLASEIVGALGDQPDELFLIGRGPSFGTAMAGSLMLKESSHTAAEALSGGQFRHGPMEMVSDRSAALLFASGRTVAIAHRMAAEIAQHGGRVLVIGAAAPGLPSVVVDAVDEPLRPMVEIVAPQLLAEAIARARGHEPGQFSRGGKVTREE